MEVHGFRDAQAYRRHVLGREMAAGPQPVSAQTVRTRLTAWRQALTDKAFTTGVCSCCAQRAPVVIDSKILDGSQFLRTALVYKWTFRVSILISGRPISSTIASKN